MRRAVLQSSTLPDDIGPQGAPKSPPPRTLPEWFELRPFQYDGRVCIAALPGLCLALALSGELLLGVLVCGGLIIHLLQNGGAKRRAVLVYICVFIAAQLTVIYSAIPLLWQSPFNIITIFLLNMSMVLTGGWAIIHFEEFLKEEPSLAMFVEMALFAVFPPVSVGVTCCVLAVLTSYRHTAYVIIIHGFLLLRLFVAPSQPSFRKTSTSSDAFVLGHAEVSLLLILYIAAPAEIFIIINITNLLNLAVIGELLLVFCLPCFLLTLLELRTWTDRYGTPYDYVIWLRWISGILSVVLGSILLSCLHDSPLVDWLGVTVLLNVLLGWTSSHKGRNINRIFKVTCSCAVVLVYILAVQYSIPWHLNLSDGKLKSTAFLLVLYGILCVVSVLVCSTSNQRLSSTMLIISMSLLVYIESVLHSQDLYSPSLMLVTAVSSSYLLVRLRTAGVTTWHCLWLGAALHAYKVPFFFKMVIRDQSGASGSFGTVILCLTVTKLLCFEYEQRMNEKKALGYVIAISTSLGLSYHGMLLPLWYIFCDNPPSIPQTVCLVIAVTGSLCFKLTSQHLAHTPQAHKFNILVIISSAISFVLQPSFKLTENVASDWLTVLAGILGLAVLLGIISPKENSFPLFIQSIVTGLACALQVSNFVLVNPSKLTLVQYTISCASCSFILLNLWANGKSKKPVRQVILTPALSFLAIVALITSITEANQVTAFSSNQDMNTPCLRLYLGISLLLTFGLRFYCFIQQRRDPFGNLPSNLTLQGNLLTIAAFLLTCLNCPIQPWEIWNSGAALLLLALQQDKTIFTSLTSRRRNGIITGIGLFSIYASTFLNSALLNIGLSLLALLETAILLITLPVFITHVLHRVLVNYNLNTELLVFLTPLNALFFLLGSSYTSWLLGGMGLGLGFWMLYEKYAQKGLH